MSINLKQLRELLKATPFPFFRDQAPVNQQLPYIVYSFVGSEPVMASNKIFRKSVTYQVSLLTKGTEKDFDGIIKVFNDHNVPISVLSSIQGDVNDDTVTNFFIEVKCIEHV